MDARAGGLPPGIEPRDHRSDGPAPPSPKGGRAWRRLHTAPGFGWRYLSDYHDRAALSAGLAAPLVAAAVLTTLVTAFASSRHVRQALALLPIEALD